MGVLGVALLGLFELELPENALNSKQTVQTFFSEHRLRSSAAAPRGAKAEAREAIGEDLLVYHPLSDTVCHNYALLHAQILV